jgi:hypothetical protein
MAKSHHFQKESVIKIYLSSNDASHFGLQIALLRIRS